MVTENVTIGEKSVKDKLDGNQRSPGSGDTSG